MREEARSCCLKAPPDVVWDYLANYANVVRLVGRGCDAQLVSGDHGVVGAQYSVTVAWEGLHSNFPTLLQEAERPMHLLFTGASPGSSGSMRFDLQPLDEGATNVTASFALALSKGMLPLEPFGWALADRMFAGVMKRLELVQLPVPA